MCRLVFRFNTLHMHTDYNVKVMHSIDSFHFTSLMVKRPCEFALSAVAGNWFRHLVWSSVVKLCVVSEPPVYKSFIDYCSLSGGFSSCPCL